MDFYATQPITISQSCGLPKSAQKCKKMVLVKTFVRDVATALRLCKFVRRSLGCRTKPSDFPWKCDSRQVYYYLKADVKWANL